MFKQIVLLSCATVLLTACLGGANSTQGVTKAGEAKSGFMGLSTTDAVTVTTSAAFKDVNEVVIGGFAVAFVLNKADSAKAGGGLMGNGFGGKSTAKSTLNGLDDATMQAVTDAAYKDFVSKLEAKGYKVADRAQLLAHEDFAKTSNVTNPYEDKSGGLLTASNTTKYFGPSSFKNLPSFTGDVPGTSFGFSHPAMGAALYAKKTGIKVLNVAYKLDFANAEGYGGWARSSSSVTVGQGLTAIPGASHIGLTGGESSSFSSNNGNIALGQPITSEKEFATVADSTSGASRTAEVAANVIGVLGGIGTNSTRDYTFETTPAMYKAAAADTLGKATDSLIGKMSSLK